MNGICTLDQFLYSNIDNNTIHLLEIRIIPMINFANLHCRGELGHTKREESGSIYEWSCVGYQCKHFGQMRLAPARVRMQTPKDSEQGDRTAEGFSKEVINVKVSWYGSFDKNRTRVRDRRWWGTSHRTGYRLQLWVCANSDNYFSFAYLTDSPV